MMSLVEKTSVGSEAGRGRRTSDRRLWCVSSVALVAAGLSGPVHAQDTGATALETITVDGGTDSGRGPDQGIAAKRARSASKTNTPLRETPQAVSVVTRDA